MAENNANRFRGSEFVQIEVEIYPTQFLASDTELQSVVDANNVIRISSERFADGSIAIAGFNYTHQINTVASGCSLDIKARGTEGTALLEVIQPNFWIDVTVQRHQKRFHVFRGRILSASISSTAGSIGGGATTHSLQVNCQSFGAILAQTQVYYDIVNQGTDLPLAYPRILISADNNQSVEDTARSLLKGFLAAGKDGTGRSVWELPINMPGALEGDIEGDDPAMALGAALEAFLDGDGKIQNEPINASGATNAYFKDALRFFPSDERRAIENYPESVNSQSLSWLSPARGGESLWAILQRWNDGPTTDMYTDLVGSDGKYLGEGQETTPKDTRMSFILRDKPFPTTTRRSVDTGAKASLFPSEDGHSQTIDTTGYWFDEKIGKDGGGYLPVFNVQWNDIKERNVTRTDVARKNAFFSAPVLTQNLTGLLIDLQTPLWDTDDIQKNGLRPVFYSSSYMLDINQVAKLAKSDKESAKNIITQLDVFRRRMRDFMCLGHLYLSGTVTLGHGRPDIRVGGKLKINAVGDQKPTDFQGDNLGGYFQEIYHIDGVSHSWSPVLGMQTSLMVTRGIRGSDQKRTQLLSEKIKKFRLAKKKGS